MANISIAGKVIKTPELKFFDSGSVTTRFSVVDKAYVKPEKGQDQAPGQFYEVQVWGKYAEMLADRLTKGSRVAVSGTAIWREYQKDGQTRKSFLITNPDVTMLDTKDETAALKGESASSEEIPF